MDNEAFGQADEETLRAYRSVFCTPAGERVLRHMEGMARVRHSITEEEQAGQPIDLVKLQIHEGMRRLYWKIKTQVVASKALLRE